jgi:hypothetical protein
VPLPPEVRIHARTTKTAVSWRYRKCDRTAAPDRFGPFAELVRLWQRRVPGDGQLPPRRAFDAFDFRPWLGRVFIARAEHDPFNLRFTLWGTKLSEWWGVDYTNKTLGEEAADPKSIQEVELAYFQEMARDPFIGVSSGRLDQHDRSFIKVVALDLPMGEGTSLTHVIGVHLQIRPEATAADVMPDCPVVKEF